MVTTVTVEVIQRKRTGFNYMTIPGCRISIEDKKETLDECIKRVFNVEIIDAKTRKREIIYAKHMKRYVLERITKDGVITDKERHSNKPIFKYTTYCLQQLMKINRATLLHSSKTAQNLIDTDKSYREAANKVINKIHRGLIVLPEPSTVPAVTGN
jgi:hypothetical protein